MDEKDAGGPSKGEEDAGGKDAGGKDESGKAATDTDAHSQGNAEDNQKGICSQG